MSNTIHFSKPDQLILEDSKRNNINIKKEENLIRDQNNQENKFIYPEHEIKWESNKQNSYHFKQDIERIWLIIRSFDLLSLINNKGHYPCISTKGQDTWKIGNEFKGNLFSIFPFIARVEKSINLPELKKIKWLCYLYKKGYFYIKFELFKVTEDNTTIILWKVNSENSQNMETIKEQCKYDLFDLFDELFHKLEALLETEPINLFQYESGIINGKMDDIWNIVTDFNKLSAIAPNNNFVPNINIGKMKVGETVKTSSFFENKFNDLDITLEYKEDRKGWNKWLFVLLITSKIPKMLPKNTILFQLTKINEDECQLTFVSKFHESIDTKQFKEISKRKKYILLSLKDYFDNFYSPTNSNSM